MAGKKLKSISCLLFILAAFASGLLSSCRHTISFAEGTHQRSDSCVRIYEEWTTTTEKAIYSIEKAAFIEKYSAIEIVQKVDADIQTIVEYLNLKNPNMPNILIVTADNLNGSKLSSSYTQGDNIITDAEKIYSREYLASLIGVVSGIPNKWIAYGIFAQIDHYKPDISKLASYYNQGGDIGILGLCDDRFFDSIAGKDTEIAKQTAAALFAYIKKTYGNDAITAILNGHYTLNMSSIKSDWLASIGVHLEYSNVHEGELDNYVFERIRNYDLQIAAPFAIYRVKMNVDGYLCNASNLEAFLLKNRLGIMEAKTLLESCAFSDELDLDSQPIYDIDESAEVLCYMTDKITEPNIIYLHGPDIERTHMHEYFHAMLPDNLNRESASDEIISLYIALGEGLTSYLTSCLNKSVFTETSRNNCDIYYDILAHQTNTEDSNKNTYQQYLISAKKYYLSHGGSLNSYDLYDRHLAIEALGYASFQFVWSDQQKGIRASDLLTDSSLNEAWTSYMINLYSVDQYYCVFKNPYRFEDIFHFSFEASIENMREKYLEFTEITIE